MRLTCVITFFLYLLCSTNVDANETRRYFSFSCEHNIENTTIIAIDVIEEKCYPKTNQVAVGRSTASRDLSGMMINLTAIEFEEYAFYWDGLLVSSPFPGEAQVSSSCGGDDPELRYICYVSFMQVPTDLFAGTTTLRWDYDGDMSGFNNINSSKSVDFSLYLNRDGFGVSGVFSIDFSGYYFSEIDSSTSDIQVADDIIGANGSDETEIILLPRDSYSKGVACLYCGLTATTTNGSITEPAQYLGDAQYRTTLRAGSEPGLAYVGADWNNGSFDVTRSVTFEDTTAPTFDVAPSVESVTSSGFTPAASIDEAGKIYYVVVADGASAPSAAQVKAGQNATGSAAVAADSATVSSSSFTSSFSAITSLSENTAYDVYFVAEDDEGTSNLQSSVTKVDVTTADVSAAPTSLSITPGSTELTVTFSAPADTGSGAIVEYQYQLDGGLWVSTSSTSTSINITGLTNGTTYSVKVRAVTTVGDGEASSAISGTPGVPLSPTSLSVTAGDTKATLTFTAPTNDGGSAITSYAYQIDGGSWVSTSSTATSINVNGLTNGTTYSFAVRAVNANGDSVVSSSVSATPAEIPLLSAKFGIAQVFSDQSWGGYRPWGTNHSGILAQSVLDAMVANDRYFAFYQANRHDADEFGFAIFNSNGSKYGDIASDITIREIGVDLISYRTNSRTNYITPSQGRLGSEVSGLSSDTTNPTVAQLQAFTPPLSVAVNSADATAPTLSSSSPSDDATGVAVDANIELTFSENIAAGTGNITLYDSSDTAIEAFDVTTADVTISGAKATINPSSNLSSSTTYYVQVDATAIDDAAGNSFAGISDKTTLNFTTADVSAPTLSSSSPSDDATGVAVDANIELTFSEAVDTETGTIVIKKVSDGSTVESFDVATSTAISGSGTTTITINPTYDLAGSTAYYIEIASTAFDDAAGNSYAGISGTTTLNFETADVTAPTLTFSPADGTTGVAADANITITFNEAVRLLDDSALSDTNVDALITLKDTNSSGSNIAFDATVSGNVITINPTSDFSSEQTVYVAIGATVEDSSDNAITASSATFAVVNIPSPAQDFAANETAIRTVLVDDMMRAVRSSLNASARMMSDVRGRLRGADGSVPTLSTRSMPLEMDGVASADAGTLSTRGTATASLIRHSGAYRRLFFSDFDIQHDLDTDNTTATLSARVAWEHMVADGTLLGYYVGAEASESDINGTFAGEQTRLGLNVGGYVAHRLADTLYTDAYVSLGVSHSDVDMSNGTLALESDYRSETVTVGASISGAYDYTDYEFRPEIAFNYGKTQIGTVFFTGRAYGLVDDTLSLNAGSVSVANVTLRPGVIYAIQNSPTANTNASLSFSPRLICERTMSKRRTQNCGSGGEVGYTAHSNDGLRNIDFRFAVDRVGSSRRSSAVLGVEMRF